MTESKVHRNAEFFPVPIDSIESDQLELEIYLIHNDGKAVLFRTPGSSYSVQDCKKLVDQGITHFYIPKTQHREFQEMVSEQLVSVYEDENISRAERTRIVRESCGRMIEDFMQDPSIPGLSETIGNMASRFTEWCRQDESKFSHLLDMSEHDFYTTTHMINVGVACGMLGNEILGTDDPMVRDLMLGGLVHDVGKFEVPTEVLNKEGKLTDEEWAMIRNHPQAGYDILRKQEGQNEITLDMALNHHERLDTNGYPNRIGGKDISLPSRICAVVDIYDALTSARPYRGPIPPRTVLDIMRKDVGSAIDGDVFEVWERIIERMLSEDPERSIPDDPDAVAPSLGEIMPASQAPETLLIEIEDAKMQIRREKGELVDVDLITMDNGEALVCSSVRFINGEQVHLCCQGQPDQLAIFQSTRISSAGDMLSAFRLSGSGSKVA